MAKLVRCPNCGAPLRTAVSKGALCAYCGASVVRDTSELDVRRPPPQRNRNALLPSIVVAGMVVAVAVVGFVVSDRRADWASSAPQAAPASPSKAISINAVPLARLLAIDVTMNVDAEKQRMPREFPEAAPDMHRVEYSFDLAHPALKGARVVWEWGCNCLSHVLLSFKDYPTEKRASESFVPCVSAELGAPSRSNPPFSYDWDAKGDWPRVSVAQSIRVDLGAPPVQQRWRRTVDLVDRCARTIVAPAH